MKNLLALSFVSVFLAACHAYTWENTHARQSLLERDRYSSEQWRDYNRTGGAFRGL